MEKINIAKLLRDCPKGMELDCTVFENLTFKEIDEVNSRILCNIQGNNGKLGISFNKFGCYSELNQAKCVIFPKGKTTWKGFVPPIKFKDGDVVISTSNNIHLISCRDKNNGWESCCGIICGKFDSTKTAHVIPIRFATEEEKQKLFDAIRENGYHWNEKTKTLEKLLKFKVGNRIKPIGSVSSDLCYRCYIIKNIEFDRYILDDDKILKFTDEHNFELDKFDITILKPFDKVLVRTDNKHVWSIQFFERLNNILKDAFVCMGGVRYHQCIPYEGNEHLLNTVNDCDDYFKTWKK